MTDTEKQNEAPEGPSASKAMLGEVVEIIDYAEPYKTFRECKTVEELTEALRETIYYGYWGTDRHGPRLPQQGDWVNWMHCALECAAALGEKRT